MSEYTKLTNDEIYTIRIVAKVISSISIFCTVCMFILYCLMKELKHIAFEFVLYLCSAVFLYNISTYIPFDYDKSIENNNFWCAVQSYMISTFHTSSLIWCAIVGFTAYISVTKPELLEIKEKMLRTISIMIGFVLPIILSFMYLIK